MACWPRSTSWVRPTLRDLANDIVMDLSALGHTLKPLIRDGYVALVPDKEDGRLKHATLTNAGQKEAATNDAPLGEGARAL